MNVDVILGVDGQVVGVYVDGHDAFFQEEGPYVHTMSTDSGRTVRRYTVDEPYPPDPYDPYPGDKVKVTVRATYTGQTYQLGDGCFLRKNYVLDCELDR